MEEEIQIPFTDTLVLLFTDESIPIQHLYRLSDMDEQQTSEFRQRWSAASDERRMEIARHLADLSENNFVVDFMPIFASILQDSYALVRVAALDGLWDCEDEKLVDPIINLMVNDPMIEVRVAAARSLAHFIMMYEWEQLPGTKLPAVFEALRGTYEDPETALPVKGAALEAMGPYSDPKVGEFIEESYEGSSPELQQSALFAMGTSANPRWLPILLDEMESPFVEMRAEAARAAGAIGASDSVSQLSELIFDEDVDVAIAAIVALAQIGGAQADRVLEELLSDAALSHLHEVAEGAMEEGDWFKGELQLFPWSDRDFEEISDFGDNVE
jgi:HEAT repeat protein